MAAARRGCSTSTSSPAACTCLSNERYVFSIKPKKDAIRSAHPVLPISVSCHHIIAPSPQATGMYQQQHYHHCWPNSSACYCVDGELKGGGDAILSSRPDALLASGGAFLPSPSPPPSSYMPHHYYSQPPPGIVVPPPMPSQLHAITHLSPTSSASSSFGMAAATSSSSSFRRTLSTGDLIIRDRDRDRDREEEQRVGLPAAAATRYSAEERRERIDKYRSKRNQRNFQKKITYACRKTLADSRPRVKGRFARNGGDYTEADVHFPAAAAAAHQSELDSPAATAAAPEWWPATSSVQEEGINLAELCAAADDDMLAAYLGVSSISIADHHYSCQP